MSNNQSIYIHQHLIEGAKKNKRSAQSKLYKMYYQAMYNTSLRIVNEPFSAEDIMQDAFIDAFKNIHSFQGNSTFGAWLKKIVINKSVNYLKKQQLIAKKLEDYSTMEDDNTLADQVDYTIEEIKTAVKKLSPQYRLVFSLYMIEGYDHDEIAQIMSISSSTSRSQLSRAKKQLKKILTTDNCQIV